MQLLFTGCEMVLLTHLCHYGKIFTLCDLNHCQFYIMVSCIRYIPDSLVVSVALDTGTFDAAYGKMLGDANQ